MQNIVGLVGLILSVAVLIVGAYKGIGALPLTLMASLVAILTNGVPVWEGFSKFYMGGYTGVYMGYFLLFASSSLYAKLMDTSGSATTIGYQFIDWFGRKKVLLVSTLVVSVLTYGGVSVLVVVFAVAPIMFLLFKEADIPRHLTMAPIITGAATYTMTALPGTPSLTNVVPTQFLGTTLTAAPVMGILASVIMFVAAMAYMNYAEKKARAAGEHWTFPDTVNPALYEIKDRSVLPSLWRASLPIVVLLAIIIVGSRFVADATLLVVVAMLVGSALTLILTYDKFKGQNLAKIMTEGLEGAIDGIGGMAGVVAFGTVVQNTAVFAEIVQWVLGLDVNAYVQGVVSTVVISAVTGSSSGGLRIMYSSLAEHFINSGVNLEILHRLTSISADALDTLPHSPGLFLSLAVLGLTHKNSYIHVFICSTLIPTVVTIVFLAVSVMMF